MIRLAYLVTHPIQYQAPLLRKIAASADFDLRVFFCSDYSTREHFDAEFGRKLDWGISLTTGYDSEVLPALGAADVVGRWRPWNYGLTRRLREGAFDVLWIHGFARPYNLWAVLAAKALGIKVVTRDDVTEGARRRSPLKSTLKRGFLGGLAHLCDGFLTVGTENYNYYLQNGVPVGKLFPVPYSVDNDFFRAAGERAADHLPALRATLNLQPHRPVILFAGKLSSRKGVQDLLDAYSMLSVDGMTEPQPYLVLVGDGELRPELEAAVAARGWNSVRFAGFKDQMGLPAYYALCDLFVLPSRIGETWGLVVNEVMAVGRAIVVSDRVGCAPDLLRPGVNGYDFRACDVDALRLCLKHAISDPERLRAMGQASLEMIAGWHYDVSIAALKRSLLHILGVGSASVRATPGI